MTLVVAFNYGTRQEIADAVLARTVAAGRLTFDEIDTEAISERLDTAGIPYPELMIPTSGEQCLSNFLLRQAAYSEFVFLPINWPDFDRAAFEAAVAEYAHRDRRFGRIEEPGRKAKIAS